MYLRMTVRTPALFGIIVTLYCGCLSVSDTIYSKNSPTNAERLNYGRIGVAIGGFEPEYSNIPRSAYVYRSRSDGDMAIRTVINTVTRILTSYPAGGGLKVLDDSKYQSNRLPAAPREQWTSLDNALHKSDGSKSLQQKLGYAIIERVNPTKQGKLSLISDYGPKILGEKVEYGCVAATYDTILELCVTKIGFESFGGIEPRYKFYINATMKLIKTTDNVVIYHDLFKYTGETEKASQWLSNDGLHLKEEIDKGINYLSWQLSLLLSPISSRSNGYQGTITLATYWLKLTANLPISVDARS